MKELLVIREKDPLLQLKLFFDSLNGLGIPKEFKNLNGHDDSNAYGKPCNPDGRKTVPLIVPEPFPDELLNDLSIPPEADFAVCSSGTTGRPKIYFRTLDSWKNFLPEQDRTFGIDPSSRMFIHGSLAFTGNLNMAFEAKLLPCFLYISSTLRAEIWVREISENGIDTIYMIPDKLHHLAKTGIPFPGIKTIICGSQFISQQQRDSFCKAFPNARILLYYGTSETSYISCKQLKDPSSMDPFCVGKTFDSVKVRIDSHGHILVRSPWLTCSCTREEYFDTGDTGFLKNGMLYLTGRSDDVINIHGEKIAKSLIEQCLTGHPQIEEAFISCQQAEGRTIIVAHIAGKNLPSSIPRDIFSRISPVFIPKKYVEYEKLPRNESGKICIKRQDEQT